MAVERRFEIIGEALNRIRNKDKSILAMMSESEKIIGLRNQIAHGYDQVKPEVLWNIIQYKIPILIDEISAIDDFI